MFRFGCLPVLLLAIAAASWGYNPQFSSPRQFVAVELPGVKAAVRVEWWLGRDWMPYSRLIVENASGKIDAKMWADWGPASRGTFYLTPENWLVVLHPSGGATAISVREGGAPEEINGSEINGSRSESWQFIGTVDKAPYPQSGYRFYSPTEQRECIPMFGMKFEKAPHFRFVHQEAQDCDWTVNLKRRSLTTGREDTP